MIWTSKTYSADGFQPLTPFRLYYLGVSNGFDSAEPPLSSR